MYELRPYQEELITNIRKEFMRGKKSVMVYLPTGGGKTVVASHILHRTAANNKKSLFIVDRIVLVDQARLALERMGLKVGIMQGENTLTTRHDDVIVASIQTLNSRGAPPDVEVVIIDEAHILHKSHIKLMKRWNNLHFIGLSATPLRPDLGKYFEGLVRGLSVKELMDMGSLCGVKAFCPSMPVMDKILSEIALDKGDYQKKELSDSLNQKELVADIVKTWKEKANNGLTLCFAVDIAHSKSIVADFLAEGISAAHMDATTPFEERQELIKKLKAGEIRILSSVNVLGIGTDIPEVQVGIMARPTLSEALQMQYVGRLLRPHHTKEYALLLDHAGNTLRFGLPESFVIPELGKGEQKTSKQKRNEWELFPCTACGAVMERGQTICPACGVDKPIRQADVVNHDGELQEYGKAKEKSYSINDKQEWYRMFLGYVRKHRFKQGWAYHQYRNKFGVAPVNGWDKLLPLEPSLEVNRWIKHAQIKYAKSKKKRQQIRQ